MTSFLFTRLSSLVTVGDLASPLQVSLAPNATLADARKRIEDVGSRSAQYSLVRDGSTIVGYADELDISQSLATDAENGDGPATVRDVMFELTPDRLLSGDTPARRALGLFKDADPFAPFFVLEGNDIVGILDYDCFFKPPFKVCLFALALQLEQRSLWLCVQDAEASWMALSAGRREKAISMKLKRDQERAPTGLPTDVEQRMRSGPDELLGYTMFIDKKTIICKRNLLPKIGKREVERAFDAVQDLRNQCAHPDTFEEPFIEAAELIEQIEACDRVLNAIEEELLPPPKAEPPLA